MYPFGIETISNIGGAAQSAYRLYKAARNATAKRQAARSRLQSFDVSLRAFDTLASSNAQLASQVDTARTAWDHVEHYLDCFENTDSSNETSRLRRICRNTKWAVAELDGKVDRMFDEVSISLQAITPALLVDLVYANTHMEYIYEANVSTRLKMEVMHQSVESLKPPGDYGVFPRLAFTTLGKPLAFNVALEVDSQRSGYNLWPSLDLQRVQCIRPYTVPGFVKLWEILETPLVRFDEPYNHETYHGLFQQALDQKNAEITQLFANGKAHALDVDPAGMIWLQKLLSHPWDFGLRNAQWGLIEFVAAESSEIGPSEKLLWMCAKWIGEGPQMPMFRTLLKLGLDPGTLDAALLRQWPAMPDPGWVGKGITSDPFFIEWLRECLQKEPGKSMSHTYTDCVKTHSI